MKKNLIVILSLSFCLLSCSKQELPNIILISADDMGWSDLGCFGSEIYTPHIDQLARQGMRFTQFHNTSKCFPSRACLLTGVYAQQNGYARSFREPLKNSVTLGEVLRGAGYITLWSGKHHGVENPVFRGFDHYYGLKDGACNHFNPGVQRTGEGVPARKGNVGKKNKRAWCIDSIMFTPYTPEETDFYTTDYFTHYAVDWLEKYRKDKRPLFLYLAYTAPHDPLMAWPEDIQKYEGVYDTGYETIREERYKRQLEMGLIDDSYNLSEATYSSWDTLSQEVKREEIRKMEVYAAMIDRLDQNIGRVLKALEETGRSENTLIMFVSDNGASAELVHLDDDYGEVGTLTRWSSLGPQWANVSNTPFRYFKNYSYEGGINTPLIAHWPGKIAPGTFSRFPGHFIDIMATYIDLTGAEYPKRFNDMELIPLQGESLLPLFLGQEAERSEALFWEWSKGQATRKGKWKLVRWGKEHAWELYNMEDDPTETNNLASGHLDRVRDMEHQFLEWKNRMAAENGN
jgi:arylsulfatase A-like enzyme